MFTRPNRITDTTRFGGIYTMVDVLILLVVVLYGFGTISEYIYPPLRLSFKICLGVVVLFWMLPSPMKPGQKNITTLIDLLKKDQTVYAPDTIYSSQEEAFFSSKEEKRSNVTDN
ncbi:hypothetical protein IGI96_002908 [Enterococcus sp. DIV0421]|uniref:DUF5592 family protein n=1 Tax=Enterococcus sp. DIV0421 TaxID=2774688 RepID=UPI003F201703